MTRVGLHWLWPFPRLLVGGCPKGTAHAIILLCLSCEEANHVTEIGSTKPRPLGIKNKGLVDRTPIVPDKRGLAESESFLPCPVDSNVKVTATRAGTSGTL